MKELYLEDLGEEFNKKYGFLIKKNFSINRLIFFDIFPNPDDQVIVNNIEIYTYKRKIK
jgi:hypothetical protein